MEGFKIEDRHEAVTSSRMRAKLFYSSDLAAYEWRSGVMGRWTPRQALKGLRYHGRGENVKPEKIHQVLRFRDENRRNTVAHAIPHK